MQTTNTRSSRFSHKTALCAQCINFVSIRKLFQFRCAIKSYLMYTKINFRGVDNAYINSNRYIAKTAKRNEQIVKKLKKIAFPFIH